MNCKDCKHYNTNERYGDWSGWCDIELPRWLLVAINQLHDGTACTVRADDTCDLWKEKK